MKITYNTIKSISASSPQAIIADLTLSAPNNHKTIVATNNDKIDYNSLPKKFNVIHITGEQNGGYTGFLNCYNRS